jgi:hypothetical protein
MQTLAVEPLQVELPVAKRPPVRQELSDLSNPLTLPLQALLHEPMARAQPPLSSGATRP